jgi:uncharacterized protein (UPF0332 family)
MTLQEWQINGWLLPHKTSRQEIADLLALSDRDLKDCLAPGLSADWRLNIAYNAALQSATAALAAAGYKANRDSHHFRIIQSLAFTIGYSLSMVTQFDHFRKKRNSGGYERAGVVSDQEANEMYNFAKQLRQDIENWLCKEHPHLF